MGFYPISPADPMYTLTTPLFDKITISLDPTYYKNPTLTIEKEGRGELREILLNGKKHQGFFIEHAELVNGQALKFINQ